MMNDKIIIYPASWLYNAGVIGLISSYPRFFTFQDGSVEINRGLFNDIDFESNYFKDGKVINLKGKNAYYPNFIDVRGVQIEIFKEYITSFNELENTGNCHVCSSPYYIKKNKYEDLKKKYAKANDFFSKIKNFDMVFNKLLGPSKSKFPNGFWNTSESLEICHLCSFVLIHHHLVYVDLFDNSQIFINAPSFKLMFELNRIVKALSEYDVVDNQKSKSRILATSIIEYARKVQANFGKWTSMNIEIVIKSKDNIEFFSLPFDVINIISDRNIATLLNEIGETNILEIILDKKYTELIEQAYKILRICLKKPEDITKNDNDLIKNFLKLEQNKSNPKEFAYKLLKLYSLIEDKLKGVTI